MRVLAKKSLGQNFLVDQRVLSRIIDCCELQSTDEVLEIGPGRGALTREILPRVKSLVAVEADPVLADGLSSEITSEHFKIVHGDFLEYDFSGGAVGLKVIGNLPYYISTPIIERVLKCRQAVSMLFMTVQLEFGRRLVARPRTKDYSSLTCLVNYFARPKILFEIGNSAFYPVPKVRSCFMRMDILQTPSVAVRDEGFFLRLIRSAFLQRRKTLVNALSGLASRDSLTQALTAAGVPLKARAEELDLAGFAALADQLAVVY